MPRFLEKKLQDKYGKDSDVPYKIMNKLGFMKGNKETKKGEEAESKHEKKKGISGEKTKEKEVKEIKHNLDEKLIGQSVGKLAKKLKGK